MLVRKLPRPGSGAESVSGAESKITSEPDPDPIFFFGGGESTTLNYEGSHQPELSVDEIPFGTVSS
jgi:hypothetical protein